VAHRIPADLRRRYERLRRLPGGLLPFGDAICAFNPVYGQGMTVAVREAVALRDCLAVGRDGLERRFLRAAARTIDDAWTLATGADLAQPTVAGRRPARVRLVNAYLRRLHAAAERDPQLALAFINVVAMIDRPQRLLHPGPVGRVLRANLRAPRRPAAPAPARLERTS
jgi:2-polyprenyl-6-methoxyphenol hydroxylase-like FAD-dependent oxidoreductase